MSSPDETTPLVSSAKSQQDVPKKSPLIFPPPPLHVRIAYTVSVWSFKAFIATALFIRRRFTPNTFPPLQPTTKIYPIRPTLKNRIFIPPNLVENEKLPLYLDVHGGGWAIGDPDTDDEFCSYMALTFRITVVSIDYHKAPTYKFPAGVHDVGAIVQAVLDDNELPIDHSKVVMGGFSAGGNLVFAACQLSGLQNRVKALVGFYSPLDSSEDLNDKLARRPKDAPPDELATSARFLDWAYVPENQNRLDPLLSPTFAKRKDLPKCVYLIGAEYDCLCYEAKVMVEKLVDPEKRREEIDGKDGKGWRQGGVMWEIARGKSHAFTHVVQVTRAGEKERERSAKAFYLRVGTWLRDDVWPVDSV
ncbi:Alpha/Beta hydrolase protein [Amylocarpus encephaloides]|uniref:Alpha/Beta hydrolase protein n=1 Tax=Amylocarpus encephaloides TaxID=45428 RepID=A0A9P7YQL4_9HELO|nr:Alpha/Beta hydrolase protein [Amylocarpus encephaloides]